MYKTTCVTWGSYVNLPFDIIANLHMKNFEMFCSLWSILAVLFPTKANRNSTASCKYHSDDLDIDSNYFSHGLRLGDIPKLDSKNNLNIFVF